MRTLRLTADDEKRLHEIMEADGMSVEEIIRRLGLDVEESFTDSEKTWLHSLIDNRPVLGRRASIRQTTIAKDFTIRGTGVHSGHPVTMTVQPAPENTGYVFILSRDGGTTKFEIPASLSSIKNLTLCTVLGDAHGNTIGSVEHFLAALRALDIDNCNIHIDSSELPILDGSAGGFVEAIDSAGTRELSLPRNFIKVVKPTRIQDGDSWGELTPDRQLRLDIEIDFEEPLIAQQRLTIDMSPMLFRSEVARARSFGFMKDVERLWREGLALGASLDNTLVVGDGRIMNNEGLRYPDEFVRHKTLDVVGDLALAGSPILGRFRSYKGGHRLNAKLLDALLSDQSAWVYVEMPINKESVPQKIMAPFSFQSKPQRA